MKSIDWLNVAQCSARRLQSLRESGSPLKGEQDTLRMACQAATRLSSQAIQKSFQDTFEWET